MGPQKAPGDGRATAQAAAGPGESRPEPSRVVVLDDDPTGTQCAADVDVALHPAQPAVAGDGPLYVLTNTRAADEQAALRIVRGVRVSFDAAKTVLVLRGDSTLRGHVTAEMQELGLADGVGLLVPAYPDAGRVTIGGVHYIDAPSGRVNVADTEFARDPVFGFRARTMAAWAAEVGLHGPVVPVSLAELDATGAGGLRDVLLRAPNGAVVIPDVASNRQIADAAQAFWAARAAGRHIVVRSAAPLAAAIAGRPGRRLDPWTEPARRLLVVCGSHTAAASRQLARLAGPPRVARTLPAGEPPGQSGGAARLRAELLADLDRDGLAIVATERERRPEHGTLGHAAAVMDRLMEVVRGLADDVSVIVSKGGITSAETATIALGGRTARVRGQICTGVSLWDVRSRTGRVVPLAVVPGNIGEDDTLVEVCAFFGTTPGRPGDAPGVPAARHQSRQLAEDT